MRPVRPGVSLAASAPVQPLSIADLAVAVRIQGRQAHVRIDQTVTNQGAASAEVANLWPAPPGLDVRDFHYTINGASSSAERVQGEQADRVYRESAQQNDDPRVLRYLGQPFFRGPAMSIPAGGRLTMRMEYHADLPVDQGVVRFHHPLSTNGFSNLPINHVTVRVSLSDREPIGFYYSPTHPFTWTRSADGSVEGAYAESNRRIDNDLHLYSAAGNAPVDFRVLAMRQTGFGGVFLASVRPGPALARSEYVARDVIFVLDRSGSMAGDKLAQAKAGLDFSLSRLNPADRFSLVWYDSTVNVWRPELQPATAENVAEAQRALRSIIANGGTNIHDALKSGLQVLGRGDRPAAVVFLTDGLPTAGVTDIGKIRTAVMEANSRRARVFVFGVGYDVNVPFLDQLSVENRGDAEYVRPGDNLEARLASFYEKQSQPVLTDLKLSLEGGDTADILPGELPDLFAGGEIVVVGRYRKPGPLVARLTGSSGTEVKTYEVRTALPDRGAAFDFLPRLWAQRKIGELLDEVRLTGPKPELIRQISALSREFGILTDYTRSLADDRVALDLSSQAAAVGENAQRANTFSQGAFATSQSVNNRGLRQQAQVYQNRFLGEDGREVEGNQARQAGARAQFLRGGFWTDPEWPADRKPLKVKRYSPAYWEILKRRPDLTATMAAGRRVRFLLGKEPIQVDDDGTSQFSAADRARLFGMAAALSAPRIPAGGALLGGAAAGTVLIGGLIGRRLQRRAHGGY